MFSPVPLINRIDRLKESEHRITLDDIWDYPVRPQRFSMWSGQPPHPHHPPSRRPAGGNPHSTTSSPLPSASRASTNKIPLHPPAKPCRITAPHTRATLPSALQFAETYGSPSPSSVLIRRPARRYRRLSPITSRTPRGPQKAGPCDARPSNLKWRIPVHHEGQGEEGGGVVPRTPLPPWTRGSLDTHPTFPSRNAQIDSAPSPPADISANLTNSDLKAEEDFTLPDDYTSTLRLSIIHCVWMGFGSGSGGRDASAGVGREEEGGTARSGLGDGTLGKGK
ncbi:hypothetical protein KC354_g13 [Hortaea werneckii]|nr:hypothetical protein KC354_g13 [Hortaea werneckii]